jgi:recombination protein RecA
MDKELIKQLAKSYGSDLVIGLDNYNLEFISSGSIELDVAMGTGGFARGRISVIAGKESSGKTTIGLKTISNAQKQGLNCAYIDTEASFDTARAKQLGIDLKNLLVLGANTLEVAGEAAVDLARSGNIDVIIFDSVAGTSVKALNAGEISDSIIGKKAKMLGHLTSKISGPVWSNKVCVIFINQLRDSLDPYHPQPVMPGGHALPYASSMTIFLSSKKSEDGDGGILVKAKITKNKLNVPFKEAEFIISSTGVIDEIRGMANILTNKEFSEQLGIIRTGAWYTFPVSIPNIDETGVITGETLLFNEEKKIQGENGVAELLRADKELQSKFKDIIFSKFTRMIEHGKAGNGI